LFSASLEERLNILVNFSSSDLNREINRDSQKEFYGREGEYEKKFILEKIKKNPYPENVKKVVVEELNRYENSPNYSGEAGIIKSYIDYLIDLPW
jgi:ATP-dependent Lon protease